jgi:hypothetical protein
MSCSEPRRRAWHAMQELRVFTAAQIQAAGELGRRNVHMFCKALLDAGYLTVETPRVKGRRGSLDVFRLVRDTGPECPCVDEKGKVRDPNTSTRLAGAARRKAWQSMRILRAFTTAQLQATAEIGERNARHFCQALRDAGYLLVTAPATGRPGSFSRYRLVRDSGPRCPSVRRDGTVYDVNLKKVFPEPAETVTCKRATCVRLTRGCDC